MLIIGFSVLWMFIYVKIAKSIVVVLASRLNISRDILLAVCLTVVLSLLLTWSALLFKICELIIA